MRPLLVSAIFGLGLITGLIIGPSTHITYDQRDRMCGAARANLQASSKTNLEVAALIPQLDASEPSTAEIVGAHRNAVVFQEAAEAAVDKVCGARP